MHPYGLLGYLKTNDVILQLVIKLLLIVLLQLRVAKWQSFYIPLKSPLTKDF